MSTPDFSIICERIAKLEVSNTHQTKKIDEIHKELIGNGQPGLIAEWNQWKGGVRLFSIIISASIASLGAVVGVLAYVK